MSARRCPTIDGWPHDRCETGTSADADEACDVLDVRADALNRLRAHEAHERRVMDDAAYARGWDEAPAETWAQMVARLTRGRRETETMR